MLFDRDGVINMAFYRNNTSYPPKTINEVLLLDGVVECIKKTSNQIQENMQIRSDIDAKINNLYIRDSLMAKLKCI